MEYREIILNEENKNLSFLYYYESKKYYDLNIINTSKGWEISFEVKDFEQLKVHSGTEYIFDEYKENPFVYGAFDEEKQVGVASCSKVNWNNTMRLWDIYVDNNYKRQKIGSELIKFIFRKAEELKVRAIVLETQSSNYNAICFYKKCGFNISGFDRIAYSNKDTENKEVRIEMAYLL
ncbi:MAG: GNAT family N-acetyltransferase [Thermotogae bacterium]|nr:GNAT family N-acetyltransferase [Thermotogota bacterium]